MSRSEPEHRVSWMPLLVLIALGVLMVWIAIVSAPHFTRARVETFLRGTGVWGPLLLFGLMVAQILIAPIPGVFMPILAGALYGPWVGMLIAAGGTLVGSAGAYFIGSRAGVPLLRRLVGPRNVERAQAMVGGRRWIALVPLFLLPFTPADAICFVSGMIGIGATRFALAVLLGRVPKDSALALAGAGLIHLGDLIRHV